MSLAQNLAPNDWFEHPELLPPRPLALTETKYIRRFALDLHGAKNHDQYVLLAPNGLVVIGLAPSHPLIAAHRRATGYKSTELRYIPPQLDHLKAEDLVSAVPDEDGQEGGEAGAATARPGALAANGSGPAAASGTATAGDPGVAPGTPGGTAGAAGKGGEGAVGGGSRGPGGGSGGGAGAGGGGEAGGGATAGDREQPAVPECEPFPPGQCSRINFDAGAGRNLAGTKASGKKRGRGAQVLRGRSMLARVERRGGGASFPVWCVLNGQLLECNERLLKKPSLLYDRPCREGYVAILSPGTEALNYFHSRLVSEPEYLKLRGLTAEDLL